MRTKGFRQARSAVVVALVGLVATVALGLVGTAGSANPNKLDLEIVDLAPSEVTYLRNIAKRVTVTNVSRNPWNKVVVSDPSPTTTAPDGTDPDLDPDTLRSTLKKVVCPGTLVPADAEGTTGDVRCDLGTLDPQEAPTLIFVWQTPSAGSASSCPTDSACIKNVVTVRGNEGSAGPDARPSKHEDTFTGEVVTTLLDTPDSDKGRAGTYALQACTTLNPAPTLSTNLNVGTGNPLSTSVCAPSLLGLAHNPGLQAYITEVDDPDAPGQTQVSHICMPADGSSCFDANGNFDPAGYTPFGFGDVFATFTFTVTNKSYTGQLDEVFYDGNEDGEFELVSINQTADPHVVSITVDNATKTTIIVVQGKKNGGYVGG